MATLAPLGRITVEVVDEEVARLRAAWARPAGAGAGAADAADLEPLLGPEGLAALDRFDAIQLAGVVALCREHATLSAAGRALFARSRLEKANPNDADRLRKYLGRFGLSFDALGPANR
jgi:transcriptional regulatory protein RtcR